MTYPVGTTFGAALQIDPIVPVNITFTLNYPDGRTGETSGVSDAFGSFSGRSQVPAGHARDLHNTPSTPTGTATPR